MLIKKTNVGTRKRNKQMCFKLFRVLIRIMLQFFFRKNLSAEFGIRIE